MRAEIDNFTLVFTDDMCCAAYDEYSGWSNVHSESLYAMFKAMIAAEPRYMKALEESGLLFKAVTEALND
jgi:hypothetical protein